MDPPGVISDHDLVVCGFPSIPFATKSITRTVQHWKKLDVESFRSAVRDSVLCSLAEELSKLSSTELFDTYDRTLRCILDEHLPPVTTTVREVRLNPWFDGECRLFRCKSRMLERRYRQGLILRWTVWHGSSRFVQCISFMKINNRSYWNSCIQSHAGSPSSGNH